MGRAEVLSGAAPLLSNWIVPTTAFDLLKRQLAAMEAAHLDLAQCT